MFICVPAISRTLGILLRGYDLIFWWGIAHLALMLVGEMGTAPPRFTAPKGTRCCFPPLAVR